MSQENWDDKKNKIKRTKQASLRWAHKIWELSNEKWELSDENS